MVNCRLLSHGLIDILVSSDFSCCDADDSSQQIFTALDNCAPMIYANVGLENAVALCCVLVSEFERKEDSSSISLYQSNQSTRSEIPAQTVVDNTPILLMWI